MPQRNARHARTTRTSPDRHGPRIGDGPGRAGRGPGAGMAGRAMCSSASAPASTTCTRTTARSRSSSARPSAGFAVELTAFDPQRGPLHDGVRIQSPGAVRLAASACEADGRDDGSEPRVGAFARDSVGQQFLAARSSREQRRARTDVHPGPRGDVARPAADPILHDPRATSEARCTGSTSARHKPARFANLGGTQRTADLKLLPPGDGSGGLIVAQTTRSSASTATARS